MEELFKIGDIVIITEFHGGDKVGTTTEILECGGYCPSANENQMTGSYGYWLKPIEEEFDEKGVPVKAYYQTQETIQKI